ncbi:hypothetical protein KQX54_001950 [Cotesia glomerata]|uniref:Uncharacterized protein n=1 Tax=Cotesia glomerata TaxID=32391 RepID=A0AAV7IK54_COTGL|nr:hypothetical protein KQX54_001950 [Cotesia glomerata]
MLLKSSSLLLVPRYQNPTVQCTPQSILQHWLYLCYDKYLITGIQLRIICSSVEPEPDWQTTRCTHRVPAKFMPLREGLGSLVSSTTAARQEEISQTGHRESGQLAAGVTPELIRRRSEE